MEHFVQMDFSQPFWKTIFAQSIISSLRTPRCIIHRRNRHPFPRGGWEVNEILERMSALDVLLWFCPVQSHSSWWLEITWKYNFTIEGNSLFCPFRLQREIGNENPQIFKQYWKKDLENLRPREHGELLFFWLSPNPKSSVTSITTTGQFSHAWNPRIPHCAVLDH